MRRMGVIFVVALIAGSLAWLQARELDRAATLTEDWYNQKEAEILRENPNINPETLRNDRTAIGAAYWKLKVFYSDKQFGQSDTELLEITGRAWFEFREKDSKSRLTSDEFVALGQGYGGLKIKSDPPGAAIRVDDKAWTEPTNTEGATRTGERAIRLSKPGYQDISGAAVVKQGQWTTFFRKLKKKQ